MRKRMGCVCVIALVLLVPAVCVAQGLSASSRDKRAEARIRKALADWVEATNRRDDAAANRIWGPNVIGWFPEAPEFGGRAAFDVAGLPAKRDASYSTYELKIDEVAVSGPVAVVYDIWTETRHFNESPVTVRRTIRGSELWRLQPGGEWKIARWVSAPEKWEKVK